MTIQRKRPKRTLCPGVAGSLATMVVTLVSPAPPAMACSFESLTPHTLDPTEQAVDTSPPGVPQTSNVVVRRGQGPMNQGCGGGQSATSCDDLGTIQFHIAAGDDRTAPAEIGYMVTVGRGTAPADLLEVVGEGAVRANASGSIFLVWIDGATDSQEDLDFDLEVRAVDRGGNISTAAVVPIRSTRGTACGVAGRSSRSTDGWPVAMFALAVAWPRRRRAHRVS